MIEFFDVSKTFHSKTHRICALNQVNVKIQNGQIYGIIGKSGSGKSTLLRCMNFIEIPESGDVSINGIFLRTLSQQELRIMRTKIGFIFQTFNLLERKNVFENIALPLFFLKKKTHEIKKIVYSLLERVDLLTHIASYPSQLSGGQKQRVAIARALATQPEFLLCDEMTSALDPEMTQNILDLIKRIQEDLKITVVVVTHEMDVIKRICDHVVVMHQGQLIEENEVVSLFCEPKHDMTKKLIDACAHIQLPERFKNKLFSLYIPSSYTLMRLAFIGKTAAQPLISQLILQFQIEINILQSQLEWIRDRLIGMMLIAFSVSEDGVRAITHYLKQSGLHVTVVGYVAHDDWYSI